MSKNRRLRGEGDRNPLSPQQCGETNNLRRFREETLELLVGKTNQLPQSLWFLLFGKRIPDMRVGSNGRESSARTMAVVA